MALPDNNCDPSVNLNNVIIKSSLLDALHHDAPPLILTKKRLKIRQLYHSVLFRVSFLTAACLLLILVPFIEHRSSFTPSTSYSTFTKQEDRVQRKYMWGSISSEIFLLSIITIDAIFRAITMFPPPCRDNESRWNSKGYFSGARCSYYTYALSLLASWLTLLITAIILTVVELHDDYTHVLNFLTMIRQLFRPVFLIAQVVVIKKALKAIFFATLQLFSVLMLLFLVTALFTMLGLTLSLQRPLNFDSSEHIAGSDSYFNTTSEAFWSLLVYLSTANSPDIMTENYKNQRASFLFYGIFFFFTNYLILKIITAFYAIRFFFFLKESVKRTYGNRMANLAIAFSAIMGKKFCRSNEVDTTNVFQQIVKLNISNESNLNGINHTESLNWESFRSLFMNLFNHSLRIEAGIAFAIQRGISRKKACLYNFYILCLFYINIFSLPIAFFHVTVLAAFLTIVYEQIGQSSENYHYTVLVRLMHTFSIILVPELIARIVVLLPENLNVFTCSNSNERPSAGDLWKRLCKWIFCGHNIRSSSKMKEVIILLLALIDLVLLASIIIIGIVQGICLYNENFCLNNLMLQKSYLITLIQIAITLVILRMFRMIMKIPSFAILIHSLLRILIVFIPFIMLAYILYYEFAIIGMAAFRGTNLTDQDAASDCGSYENLDYDSYNFEDYGSSLVLLWNLMIVNNWHIITDAYVRRHSFAVRIYFVLWWLISETIINGVLFGILLEILFEVMKNFFNLREKFRKEESPLSKTRLVFIEYFWWGRSTNEYPVLALSWNVHNVLNEVCNLEETERMEIEEMSLKVAMETCEQIDLH